MPEEKSPSGAFAPKRKTITFCYVVPGAKVEELTSNYLPIGAESPAIIIYEPPGAGPGLVDCVTANIGEIVPRVYQPFGLSAANATANIVREWSNRFTHSVTLAIDSINEAKRLAKEGLIDMDNAVPIWDDPPLVELAKRIAEFCEFGTALLAVGRKISMNVDVLEKLLMTPIQIEIFRLSAPLISARIAVNYAATLLGEGASVNANPFPDLVDLDQIAAIVGRKKRSLERYLGEMPVPHVQGMGGKKSIWLWPAVREWAIKRFNMPDLPARYPSVRKG